MNVYSTTTAQANGGSAVSTQKPASTSGRFSSLLTACCDANQLREEAANPNSGFWQNIQNNILETAKIQKELREEEETFQLLSAILDNASGKDVNPAVSAAVGLRLAQDRMESGCLPTELHAYLLTLGSKTTYEVVEDPEEEENIQEVDAVGIEELSDKRHGLSDAELARLAEKYDPNNMTPEEYDQFLQDLVELGAVSQAAAERIHRHGSAAGSADHAPYLYTGPAQNTTPVLNRSPIDNNIESWLQNRLLWKPGITRESARREGFTAEYQSLMDEEKTLSKIAVILKDVKRQRSPGVSL